MSFGDALATFTTLTVGDGLVSQIPALLVSTAAGIVVSKGAIEGKMHGKLASQLGSNANPLMIASAAAGILALLPGLPTMPFLLVSGVTGAAAWHRFSARTTELADAVPAVQPPDEGLSPIATLDVLRVELGYGLLELASGIGPQLPDQIKRLRRALASELGFVLPSVRIQDNVSLDPYSYTFALKEIPAGAGELRPLMMLAISPGDQAAPLPGGERTTEPTFGLPACWITPAVADQARSANWTVVDPSTVLTTHLAEVVKENIAEFLSYSETQKLLASLSQDQQKLVSDLVPSVITVGGVQRVLQMLLAERVSIRDMPTILEAIQEACANNSKSVSSIVAHVRTRLSRQISESHIGNSGYVPVIVISPEWEETLTGALVGPQDDRQLALSQDKLREFLDRIRMVVDAAMQSGEKPVMLTSMHVRPHVHSIVERIRMNVAVIAQAEIHRRSRVKVVGTI